MKIICFDLDNTLVKSSKVHLVAFKKAFKEFGLKRKSTSEIMEYFSLTGPVIIKKLYPELSKKEATKVAKRHDYLVINETAKYVKIIPGAKTTLRRLKKYFKVVILSNAVHDEVEATLKHAKISNKLFDLIIGHDEVKKGKPAPDMLIKAMRKLKVKDGYMVGDSPYDLIAGKKAGLRTIGVTTGNHSRRELMKENPDMVLKSVADLKKKII